MGAGHAHRPPADALGGTRTRTLGIAIALNVAIVGIQIVAGPWRVRWGSSPTPSTTEPTSWLDPALTAHAGHH